MNGNRETIINFLVRIINDFSFNGVIIGISGGVDSAVTASLCSEALGPKRVFGLLLPERDSSRQSVKDAKTFCEDLGILYHIKDITGILKKLGIYNLQPLGPPFMWLYRLLPNKIIKSYVKNKWETISKDDIYLSDLENKGTELFQKSLAYYRAKHRVRMCQLYLEADKKGYAVVGCTNKTEYLTGLYVKWGDTAVDIEPIIGLYKTEISKLAKELEIPQYITNKAPSPDLIPGISDKDVLKLPYSILDRILMKIENNENLRDERNSDIERVKKLMEAGKWRQIERFSPENYTKKPLKGNLL
ncbi:MAG: NAD(+) synthase [Thermotogota bacterium]|nr:NAD(+) synthase [Thermotogota bacterium]